MIGMSGDPMRELPCVQLTSYLEGSPLIWMVLLHMHSNLHANDDGDDNDMEHLGFFTTATKMLGKILTQLVHT